MCNSRLDLRFDSDFYIDIIIFSKSSPLLHIRGNYLRPGIGIGIAGIRIVPEQ